MPRLPLIEDDNKKPEEIEAEERARIASANLSALAGLAVRLALGSQENDEVEDFGFIQNM